jgi:uncharacterized damage-inducible protein DinB
MRESGDEVERPEPPHVADERATLAGFLDYQRATLLRKVAHLSDAEARRHLVPSPVLTLGGLVQHLTFTERYWFREVLAGERGLDYPWTDTDPDADFRMDPAETLEEVVAAYQRECARSRDVLAALPDLDLQVQRGADRLTARWVVVHMIEETARHNGHADLLREQIDGRTGE